MNTLLYEVLEADVHRALKTDNSLAGLVLRVVTGIIFLAHGSEKLFGGLGQFGIERLWRCMASIGLEPGFPMALVPGSLELICGLALLLGVLTRAGAIVVGVTIIVAIILVFFGSDTVTQADFEFELALLAMSFALAVQGAGAMSLDRFLSGRIKQNEI